MNINIRGTSGSGKSTLVNRLVTNLVWETVPQHIEGRKQPLYDLHYTDPDDDSKGFYTLGHYNTACGGCDTISMGMDFIYDTIRSLQDTGYHVVFEGLLMNSDINRCVDLAFDYDTIIIDLDTSIEVCLTSVNQRRRIKKPDAPDVNPHNTEAKYKQCLRAYERLTEADCIVHRVDRDEAYRIAYEVLS